MSEDAFAPPPFKAEEALLGLRRSLRELGLAERAGRYELRGLPVCELALEDGAIGARLVQRPARTPEWRAQRLRSGADVRRFVEDLKRQLARWSDRDE